MNSWETILEVIYRWKHLGVKTTDLTKATLVGHVPHVAPEAWFHSYYLGLNDIEIHELESKMEIIFPKSIHEFLAYSNGIKLFSDALRIFGIRKHIGRTLETIRQPYDIISCNSPFEKPVDSPESLMLIGSYGMDGSILYFHSGEEAIYYSSRDSINPKRSWSNFWDMLTEEAIRLASLFDTQGKKINPKVPTIPDVVPYKK